MKIYVVGTGGVGGYFGALLAKANSDVTFVARGDNFQAIKQNGIIVKSVVGDFQVNPIKVIENISEIIDPDLVLFTVKTYQTEETTKELSQIVKPETIVITFQNGIDNDQRIKKILPNTQVYPGVAYVISAKTAPGVISQTGGLRRLIFGDRQNPNNLKLKEIGELFIKSGIDTIVSEDITNNLWKKYLYIIPFAGLTAYKRQSIGEILSNNDSKNMYEGCLAEAINVAKKIGVKLDMDIFESVMTISKNTAPNAKSSLLIDIENNRPTEIEYLHGTLLKLAKEKNIKTPITEKIYLKIKSFVR